MAIYAVKRKDETNERLIKRWKKQCQASRIINQLRARRYWKKDKTKRIVRAQAIKRSYYRMVNWRAQFYA